jgi:hypothetical protein
MNERKPRTSQHQRSGRTGAHAAPIAVDDAVVAPSTDQAKAPASRESSHVVYCESELEVSEGFAIALRAMGFRESDPWTD